MSWKRSILSIDWCGSMVLEMIFSQHSHNQIKNHASIYAQFIFYALFPNKNVIRICCRVAKPPRRNANSGANYAKEIIKSTSNIQTERLAKRMQTQRFIWKNVTGIIYMRKHRSACNLYLICDVSHVSLLHFNILCEKYKGQITSK